MRVITHGEYEIWIHFIIAHYNGSASDWEACHLKVLRFKLFDIICYAIRKTLESEPSEAGS